MKLVMQKALAVLYVLYVIGWQWYLYHFKYPDEWYRSLGSGLFDMVFVVLLFGTSCACRLYLKRMRIIFFRIWMFSFMLLYYIVMFSILYYGTDRSGIDHPDVEIKLTLLAVGVLGFFLTRRFLSVPVDNLLTGEVYGSSIFDGFKSFGGLVKENGEFREENACLLVTGFSFCILMLFLPEIIHFFR